MSLLSFGQRYDEFQGCVGGRKGSNFDVFASCGAARGEDVAFFDRGDSFGVYDPERRGWPHFMGERRELGKFHFGFDCQENHVGGGGWARFEGA